jgi:hypothetical protein
MVVSKAGELHLLFLSCLGLVLRGGGDKQAISNDETCMHVAGSYYRA